jgi:hemerythrin-like metal-binding protein
LNDQIGRVHADDIGRQHGRLDFLIEHAAAAGTLDEAAQRCLEIARYFELHAYDEEQYMAQHLYPHLEQHRSEHVEIVNTVRSLLEEAAPDLGSVRSALRRVRDLMGAHRSSSDRRYFEYMKSLGVLPADAHP